MKESPALLVSQLTKAEKIKDRHSMQKIKKKNNVQNNGTSINNFVSMCSFFMETLEWCKYKFYFYGPETAKQKCRVLFFVSSI
jgi:hypothetical protein